LFSLLVRKLVLEQHATLDQLTARMQKYGIQWRYELAPAVIKMFYEQLVFESAEHDAVRDTRNIKQLEEFVDGNKRQTMLDWVKEKCRFLSQTWRKMDMLCARHGFAAGPALAELRATERRIMTVINEECDRLPVVHAVAVRSELAQNRRLYARVGFESERLIAAYERAEDLRRRDTAEAELVRKREDELHQIESRCIESRYEEEARCLALAPLLSIHGGTPFKWTYPGASVEQMLDMVSRMDAALASRDRATCIKLNRDIGGCLTRNMERLRSSSDEPAAKKALDELTAWATAIEELALSPPQLPEGLWPHIIDSK
jgi:hypothetical protein